MTVASALAQRRAIKHYDPSFVMPAADMHALLNAALLAPTSFNIQNWRFVAVTDQSVKQELRAAAWDQTQVTDASLMIVLCADLKAWEKDPARYWHTAPADVQTLMVRMIDQFYRGKEQLQRDEAMRSCGMAAQSVMLMAQEMGYDTCPMVGFDTGRVAHIVRLPADHVVCMMIAVGKKTEEPQPRGGQLPSDAVVFADRFPA